MESKKQCEGVVVRFSEKSHRYVNKNGQHIVSIRHELRVLVKQSCPGCDKCKTEWDYFDNKHINIDVSLPNNGDMCKMLHNKLIPIMD